MRKVVVQEFMSLDGVIQAPGARDEDPGDGYPYGGWTAPYTGGGDPRAREFMVTNMAPADLLLGRKTFEIFEAYWPDHAENWPGILDVNKYVVSTTLEGDRVAGSRWPNCRLLRSVDDVEAVKRSAGSDLKVWGSSVLVRSLLERGLVDELVLMTYPVVLGTGKKLFGDGAEAAAFTLTDSVVTPDGVFLARYARSGEVRTGTVGASDTP